MIRLRSVARSVAVMLETIDLTRRFGPVTAVDKVSISVRSGELTGFVGGNGAGKTTTMRMVMGVLGIHGGRVTWQGRDVTAADRRRFGYMPEERGLYPKQGVLDQLVYLGQLAGMSAVAARCSAAGLLDRFGLADRARDKVEKLSLGNQQRVQIIGAVLADPVAMVLDEPFSGLDPTAVDAMADLLREHTRRGVPVLFSSHQLDLVDRRCDRLVIMARGRSSPPAPSTSCGPASPRGTGSSWPGTPAGPATSAACTSSTSTGAPPWSRRRTATREPTGRSRHRCRRCSGRPSGATPSSSSVRSSRR